MIGIEPRVSHKENRYYVTDLGSSNGTFVNGQRLSKAKEESEPREIGHGTVIQVTISSTFFTKTLSKELIFRAHLSPERPIILVLYHYGLRGLLVKFKAIKVIKKKQVI